LPVTARAAAAVTALEGLDDDTGRCRQTV